MIETNELRWLLYHATNTDHCGSHSATAFAGVRPGECRVLQQKFVNKNEIMDFEWRDVELISSIGIGARI